MPVVRLLISTRVFTKSVISYSYYTVSKRYSNNPDSKFSRIGVLYWRIMHAFRL